jgi:hypothetical protein
MVVSSKTPERCTVPDYRCQQPLSTPGIKRIARTRLASGFQAPRDFLSDEIRAALEWIHDVEGIAAVRERRSPRVPGR